MDAIKNYSRKYPIETVKWHRLYGSFTGLNPLVIISTPVITRKLKPWKDGNHDDEIDPQTIYIVLPSLYPKGSQPPSTNSILSQKVPGKRRKPEGKVASL